MQAALMGHNKPPTELEILQLRLGNYIKESERLKTFQTKEIPVELTDCQEAGKLTDHIKALKVFRGDISKIFKKEKSPFFDCCKAADAWKNGYWTDLDILIAHASKPVLAWNKKKEEEERQRQLQIARDAQEKALKLEEEAAAHSKEGIEDTAEELTGRLLINLYALPSIQQSGICLIGMLWRLSRQKNQRHRTTIYISLRRSVRFFVICPCWPLSHVTYINTTISEMQKYPLNVRYPYSLTHIKRL